MNNPTTTVVMSIPYYYDLLSPQGIRDWNSQRAATIEQEYVTTIKKDSLVKPGSFQTVSEYQPSGFSNEFTQETPVDSETHSVLKSGEGFIPDFSFGEPQNNLTFKFT